MAKDFYQLRSDVRKVVWQWWFNADADADVSIEGFEGVCES